MKRRKQKFFDAGQALWNQRQHVYQNRARLQKLAKAVNWISDSSLAQYAQLFTTALQFEPSLIIEVGRGRGNSTAVLTEVANHLPKTRKVLSICLSNDWQKIVAKRVSQVVEPSWFAKLDARIANICDISLGRFIHERDSVLFLWDAHGFEVAECVLGKVLPQLQQNRHLVLIHDILDVRHHPHLKDYKRFGIWKGYPGDQSDGAWIIVDSMASMFEEVIALNDFAQRNNFKIHSVEHEVRQKIFNYKIRRQKLKTLLGSEMTSPTSGFHWFSLNELPKKQSIFFPSFRHSGKMPALPRKIITQPLPGQPLVSIVTPCFNSERYLRECIESVLNQDYPKVEHIIQDGASTDGTLDILKQYSAKKYRKRIKWKSKKDKGQADGLNKALQRAKGDILLVLNADDILLPFASSWGVEQLARYPDCAVVYGDEYIINEAGDVIDFFVPKDPYTFERLFSIKLVLPAQAAFIRRAMLETVGLYADPSLATCPDYEMWVRIGMKFPMKHVHGPVCKYRHHIESEGRREDMLEKMMHAKRMVINRILSDPKTPIRIGKLKQRAYSGLYQWGSEMSGGIDAYHKELSYQWRSFIAYPRLHSTGRLAWVIKHYIRRHLITGYHQLLHQVFISLSPSTRSWLKKNKKKLKTVFA